MSFSLPASPSLIHTYTPHMPHYSQIQIPKMVSDVPSSFADIPTETMARQLTWVEHELYSRMKP